MAFLKSLEETYPGLPKELLRLRVLVEVRYDVQDVRIATLNRLRSIGMIRTSYPETLKKIEDDIDKEILQELKQIPIWNVWLSKIKGVGVALGGGLIARIGDIGRFPNVSKLWAYCGLHVVDGAMPQRKKGSKINWNPHLRVLAWKLGEAFVKTKGFYRKRYEEFREMEDKRDYICDRCKQYFPDRKQCIDKHRFARAKRKTVKMFMAHLFDVWRKLEGLPTPKPYAFAFLGHSKYIPPPSEG